MFYSVYKFKEERKREKTKTNDLDEPIELDSVSFLYFLRRGF